jgi:hypothetical protein
VRGRCEAASEDSSWVIDKGLCPRQHLSVNTWRRGASPPSVTQACAESFACRLRDLFIFECDVQGCAKASDELSYVIPPVCFLGEIAALAPTGTEII